MDLWAPHRLVSLCGSCDWLPKSRDSKALLEELPAHPMARPGHRRWQVPAPRPAKPTETPVTQQLCFSPKRLAQRLRNPGSKA